MSAASLAGFRPKRASVRSIIVLAAATTRDCFDLTVTAFNLSEKYRTPVILLTDEVVAHTREKVVLPEPGAVEVVDRLRPTAPPEWYVPYADTASGVPPMGIFGDGYRYHVTGLFHDPMGFPTQRLDEIDPWLERINTKLERRIEEIAMVKEDYEPGARTALLSYGCSARTARHAMQVARARGRKVDMLTLFTIWPFPEEQVEALGERVERIIVPEMNLGQLAYEVERIVGRKKVKRVVRANGEMVTPQMVLEALEG